MKRENFGIGREGKGENVEEEEEIMATDLWSYLRRMPLWSRVWVVQKKTKRVCVCLRWLSLVLIVVSGRVASCRDKVRSRTSELWSIELEVMPRACFLLELFM